MHNKTWKRRAHVQHILLYTHRVSVITIKSSRAWASSKAHHHPTDFLGLHVYNDAFITRSNFSMVPAREWAGSPHHAQSCDKFRNSSGEYQLGRQRLHIIQTPNCASPWPCFTADDSVDNVPICAIVLPPIVSMDTILLNVPKKLPW